ncbi:hypothetical protein FCL40_05270 [Ferrimonas sediminicola]|uniref:Uncharacterized protein n=1 Tax=Ferrimonas sediminicola TaxID=2569538 RepID=A0A4U1BGU1_9GAMM|nr:hypothetical protein [Ferrimonas sediminicola]TKB50562.1 hypothetical protein FCL40_05270 [Ferrimonas sediminicola]
MNSKTQIMLSGLFALAVTMPTYAAKPVDLDGDGVQSAQDCNDNDANVWQLNSCGVCEVEPVNGCAVSPHDNLAWGDYPSACINCHDGGEGGSQYQEMFGSTHYQWTGETPDMVNQGGTLQGKLTNAVNSYCINIEGDWPVCGSCHAGRGTKPGEGDTIANVDCLMCHNKDYALNRVRKSDGSLGPADGTAQADLDGYVQNIAAPERTNCLKCHAYAGGGDGVKRGDLSSALMANGDAHFDVHMNVTGANLQCQDCHKFESHRVIGKGSDLRPTDDIVRGAEINCANSACHDGMDSGTGHASSGRRGEPDRHVPRVACQSCHIPTYAKDLGAPNHVPTEMHRDWQFHHDGTPADGVSGPGHPHTDKLANQVPEVRFWNRKSDNYLLGDLAKIDPETGLYPTSRPLGDVNDGKLTPFKYKTAHQPMTSADGRMIALDTFEYLKASGDVSKAIENGLSNMGYPINEPYEWIETDTFQMINHGVNPASEVADCTQCHEETLDLSTDSKLDAMGFKLKGPKEQVCNQCHDGTKNLPRTWDRMHNHVQKGSGIGCYFCHDVKRPERNLCDPCDSSCSAEFVDNVPYPHQCSN